MSAASSVNFSLRHNNEGNEKTPRTKQQQNNNGFHTIRENDILAAKSRRDYSKLNLGPYYQAFSDGIKHRIDFLKDNLNKQRKESAKRTKKLSSMKLVSN